MNSLNINLTEHIIVLTTLVIISLRNSKLFYLISPIILIIQILITFYFDVKSTETRINCKTYEIPLIRKYVTVCPK